MRFGEDGPYRQAFPLPGSPTVAAGCKTASYLPKTNPRRYRQNCQPWGHTGARPRTTVAGGDSSCKAVSLGFKTLVCLFVAGQPRAWKKNINVILSPMSHRSAQAEMPRSSRHRARGSWGRARGTPKAAHPSSCCMPGPAPMPSPSPQLGTPVARGHQWRRDNFLRPGRRHRNLHLYLHFLIAPAGFLGQRLPLVSMAGFVRTPRTEGGTKGPQWTCHSPASKAAGGAGQGHRGQGHRSLPPPPAPGWTQGALQAGEEAANTRGTLVVLAPPEQWWGHAAGSAPQQRSRASTTIARRWQPPCARRKWCKSRTQMFPLFSLPVIFSQLSTQLGWVSFPFQLPDSI